MKRHAGEHIGGEQALPVLVGNLEGVLDLEDAHIVDQNIDVAGGLDDFGDALGVAASPGAGYKTRFGQRGTDVAMAARHPLPCGR